MKLVANRLAGFLLWHLLHVQKIISVPAQWHLMHFPKDTVIPIGHMGSVIQRHLPELIRISGTERKVCIYSLVNIQLIRVL